MVKLVSWLKRTSDLLFSFQSANTDVVLSVEINLFFKKPSNTAD